jgi:prevent-host-death family protein
MHTATVEEAQAHLPELLQQVSAGEEVVITSQGTPVGRLVPPVLPTGVPIPGRGKGKFTINAEDDEYLKDFADYMP